ncbi:MAG: EamA family transporter [Melioribacteraceae bacterium]|nr:EamA family transporter [Melioribacteraceae bacterium]
MIYLFLVSLLWAFSFGLIKNYLTGIDAGIVAVIRLLISFLFFIPFIRYNSSVRPVILKLAAIGAVQYGVMYVAYIYSFQFLESYEVALFTIFTPVYITLINDRLNRKFNKLFFASSMLAIIGTGIIVFKSISDSNLLTGFLLVQISNFCFAYGQIFYVKLMEKNKALKEVNLFGYVYFGALIIPAVFVLFTSELSLLKFSIEQIIVLIYLGGIASGIGFFLWNYGARRTNVGALAIFNNLKIPLAITVSFAFFNETADIFNLSIGGIIVLLSLLLNQYFLNKKLSAGKVK